MGTERGSELDAPSCEAENFKFVALTSLMSARIALHPLWNLSSRRHAVARLVEALHYKS